MISRKIARLLRRLFSVVIINGEFTTLRCYTRRLSTMMFESLSSPLDCDVEIACPMVMNI